MSRDTLRVGLIGCGTIGTVHARHLSEKAVPQARLVALCDARPGAAQRLAEQLGGGIEAFDDTAKLLASKRIDAVIIAAPHYFHVPLAIEAFSHGLHVLVEKPAGVYTAQVHQMNRAAAQSGKVFAIMFNRRLWPNYIKLRELVASQEFGPVLRTTWQATNWYRPQAYYDADSWRGTWAGEGGGVLLNQCIHQLDLWQWICGMPQRVRAFCHFGKHHEIDVEDDVTAYAELPSGATGLFLASTGEPAGTDRLEISCQSGKMVIQDDRLTITRSHIPQEGSLATHKGGVQPKLTTQELDASTPGECHGEIIANWVRAILHGEALVAPGQEGVHSLELANAMLLSSWLDDWVALPVDEQEFQRRLEARARPEAATPK